MIWVFVPTHDAGTVARVRAADVWRDVGWRRVWARRDHQALFYTAVVILCGIWVQLWYDNNISRRYALPIVLMAVAVGRTGAVGVDGLAPAGRSGGSAGKPKASARWPLRRRSWSWPPDWPGVASTDEPRRMAADVGRWVRQDFSTPTLLLGPPFMSAIVRYYAQNSSYMTLPAEADDASVLAMVAQTRADVVILWPSKRFNPERLRGARSSA